MDLKDHTLMSLAYIVFFITAVVFSILINGLLLKFSKTLGNRHDLHRHTIRWASSVKPSVGGFSFYILFLISVSSFGFFNYSGETYLNKQLLGIVFAVNTGFLLGLADDAYNTIPVLKFFGQLLCGVFLVATGTIIPGTGIQAVDILITLIWVVGMMNSINMLDNMDGIGGTVSLVILIACILALAINVQVYTMYSFISIGVAGALVGFLFHNWYPARIYMGDTGSQFLGAFISAISVYALWNNHTPAGGAIQFKQYLIPLLAFTVPLIDTLTVCIRRIARGQSPFVGGRDHISHHFVYAGLSDNQVTLLLGGISAFSAGLASLLLLYYDTLTTGMVAAGYVYFLLLFAITQFYYDIGKRKERARHEAALEHKEPHPHPHSATA